MILLKEFIVAQVEFASRKNESKFSSVGFDFLLLLIILKISSTISNILSVNLATGLLPFSKPQAPYSKVE